MPAAIVWSIWARVRDRVLGDPYQIVWSHFGGEEPMEDAIVQAYQHFDRERIWRSGAYIRVFLFFFFLDVILKASCK